MYRRQINTFSSHFETSGQFQWNFYSLESINTLVSVTYKLFWLQGRPFPLRPWCIFPPCFRFPPIFDKFSDCGKFPKCHLFPKNCRFSSAKISDDFFSNRPQISNSPSSFHVLVHFPYFPKIIISPFPPYFHKFPPVSEKFTCFLHTLCVFRFPLLWPWCIYASPNARTGRPCLTVMFAWCSRPTLLMIQYSLCNSLIKSASVH